MDAREIVVHEVDRHHMRVVRCLLRKVIGESRRAAVAHAHRKIATRHKRRADMLLIGAAFDTMLVRASANRGAVAVLTFRRGAVHLYTSIASPMSAPNAPSIACKYGL